MPCAVRALPLALILLAMAPAAAGAATVTVSGSALTFNAGSGEANALRISKSAGNLRVVDTGATAVTANAGCTQVSPRIASCPVGGVTVVNAYLWDQDDSAIFTGGSGNDTLDAGTGSLERLNGRGGNDTVKASASTGTAYLRGGDGNDTLTGPTSAGSYSLGVYGVLDGGAGTDKIVGSVVGDALSGGPGADTRSWRGSLPRVTPPALLLHGFPDSHRLWRHQVGPLEAAGHRVIAPDLRGFGEAPKPQEVEAYRIGTIVQEDIVPLLEGDEPAYVIGHDWGAAIAWALALMRPDLVSRLAVLSVGHPNTRATRTMESREKAWYQLAFQFPEAEELFLRDDAKLFREWIGDVVDLDRYLQDLSRPGAMTAALNYYRANLHPRNELAFSPLPPCTVPTLGLWSDGDRFLSERQMQRSGEHCTNGFRYERVENATHWMQLDQPERVTELLLSARG